MGPWGARRLKEPCPQSPIVLYDRADLLVLRCVRALQLEEVQLVPIRVAELDDAAEWCLPNLTADINSSPSELGGSCFDVLDDEDEERAHRLLGLVRPRVEREADVAGVEV
jgi:hypothetical protein